ncbi:hypothetical protein AMJ71_09860 [candidate division TA06 bacterium SM1_40]|uniref:DUF4440 domain-containing protein n=1 Tax=candidate division TA06 bacterium SM1_40 TaxID=1703773 RepID=A0A0S8JC79_UNCT6|nr:MAG: hypothetical protein AMJ71_09860 [candidate division TA06 bacterium SM1_40]
MSGGKRMRAVLASPVVVLCLCGILVVSVCSQAGSGGTLSWGPSIPGPLSRSASEGTSSEEDTAASRPLAVFSDVEEGWRREEVSLLSQHFGDTPILISFSRGGPRGGTFSSMQAEYALRDHFHYTVGESFEFVEYQDGEEPLAIAVRSYRFTEEDVLYHDHVQVVLTREDDEWVISEIRAAED